MIGFCFLVFICARDLSFVAVCHRHLIMIVSDCGVAEQFIIKYIVPASCCDRISPVKIDFTVIEMHSRTTIIIIIFFILFVVVMVFLLVETQEEATAI